MPRDEMQNAGEKRRIKVHSGMSHVERIAGDCLSCVFDRLALGNDVLTADQVKPFAFRSM